MFNRFSVRRLKKLAKTNIIGKDIIYMPVCVSTNNVAKELSRLGHGTLFVADKQTGGRGRSGRSWESKKGDGIYMSLLLKPDNLTPDISQLTLITAIAAARAIGGDAKIKWPNDIVLSSRKVCGILTELSGDSVIVGVGINVNNKKFPKEIKDIATSLYIEHSRRYSRESIIADFLHEFEVLYDEFSKSGFSVFRAEYKKLSVNIGREVRIIKNNEEIAGTATDISRDGKLVVDVNGEFLTVQSGEVSIRGMYGYA